MTNTNKNLHDGDEVTLLDFDADADAADEPKEPEVELDTEKLLEAAAHYTELEPAPTYQSLAGSVKAESLPVATATEAANEDKEVVTSKSEELATETASLTSAQLQLISSLLVKIAEHSKQINDIISPYLSGHQNLRIKTAQTPTKVAVDASDALIIEGVFDGEQMIGPDGQSYSVPANYASKSRLVEGDLMKLTITANGTFIYKQIEPIDRRRLTGVLEETETGEYLVMADDRRWHVLDASVTYYKGEAGDQVTIVIPQQGLSKWAAIENIVKR